MLNQGTQPVGRLGLVGREFASPAEDEAHPSRSCSPREVFFMKTSALRLNLVSLSLGAVALSYTLSSCGVQPSTESDVDAIGARPSISYSKWCAKFALQKCDLIADNSTPLENWRAGVDVFSEVLNSLTSISLSRADFDRATVQQLFSTFGANSLLTFISKIPWQKLEKVDNTIVLVNAANNAVAIFNGLRLIGSQKVVAKFVDKQLVSMSGLSIADSKGGNLSRVLQIDLSKPARMSIVTDKERIEDIPLQFFQVGHVQPPPNLTPATAFKAIADVVLEPNFDWRRNFSIMLKGSSLSNIYNRVRQFIPQGAADDTTRQVVANTDMFMVGGASSNILLSVQMKNPLKCTAKVANVPLLGSIDFDIDFLRGFGLSDVKRIQADGVSTKVYGISTSLGSITNVEVDSKQLRLKVGALTLPIDFSSLKQSGRGPSVQGVKCQ